MEPKVRVGPLKGTGTMMGSRESPSPTRPPQFIQPGSRGRLSLCASNSRITDALTFQVAPSPLNHPMLFPVSLLNHTPAASELLSYLEVCPDGVGFRFTSKQIKSSLGEETSKRKHIPKKPQVLIR